MRTIISKERILQITNDISEDMCTAKRPEIIEVASYWANRAADTATELAAVKNELALIIMRGAGSTGGRQ